MGNKGKWTGDDVLIRIFGGFLGLIAGLVGGIGFWAINSVNPILLNEKAAAIFAYIWTFVGTIYGVIKAPIWFPRLEEKNKKPRA